LLFARGTLRTTSIDVSPTGGLRDAVSARRKIRPRGDDAEMGIGDPLLRKGADMTVTNEMHLPPLGVQVREEVGGELQATLVDLIDLTLWGKQLHWSVAGPLFQVLHERLDELVDSWRDLADTVAERAVAVGQWPDGQAQAVAAGKDHTTIERGLVEDQAVLRLLAGRLSEVSERSRQRLERLGELDLVSQDVLIEVVRKLEEQLWMSRAQLPGETSPGRA
jgi:starvation-inducible DNA-binding protein